MLLKIWSRLFAKNKTFNKVLMDLECFLSSNATDQNLPLQHQVIGSIYLSTRIVQISDDDSLHRSRNANTNDDQVTWQVFLVLTRKEIVNNNVQTTIRRLQQTQTKQSLFRYLFLEKTNNNKHGAIDFPILPGLFIERKISLRRIEFATIHFVDRESIEDRECLVKDSRKKSDRKCGTGAYKSI